MQEEITAVDATVVTAVEDGTEDAERTTRVLGLTPGSPAYVLRSEVISKDDDDDDKS